MTEVATTPAAPSEAGVLAAELGRSFGRMVQFYEEHFSLSREEAARRAAAPAPNRPGRKPTGRSHVMPAPGADYSTSGISRRPTNEPPAAASRTTRRAARYASRVRASSS